MSLMLQMNSNLFPSIVIAVTLFAAVIPGKAETTGQLIKRWYSENTLCRGGPGNASATNAACARREKTRSLLESRDMCYGRPGESGFQMEWHACGL